MVFVGLAFLVVLNIIIAIIADAYVEATAKRKVLRVSCFFRFVESIFCPKYV